LEVEVRRLDEALALGAFNRRETPALYCVRSFTKSKDHVIGIKGWAHNPMIRVL
jgi:hypothetical protein